MSGYDNVWREATWSVSSAEQDHGVECLVDESCHTYWQSKGILPHTIEITFAKRTVISSIQFYISYSTDTSYSPLLVSILFGSDGIHFQEYKTFTIGEIDDWFVVNTIKDNRPLTTFALQIVIHEMHNSGRNTRLRQVKILSPKPSPIQNEKAHSYSDFVLYEQSSIRFPVCFIKHEIKNRQLHLKRVPDVSV